MKKAEVRRELQRLIDEAPAIAPAIVRFKGQSYGEVTDEDLDTQKAQRWELEARSLLQGLASSGGQPFALLNGQYHEEKARSSQYHSKSIFIHKAVQCLTTAIELLDAAASEIVLPHAQHLAAAKAEVESPQRITIPWLLKHVPVSLWLSACGILLVVFLAGAKVAGLPLMQQILGTSTR